MVHTNVLNIIQLRTPGFEIFDDIANGSDPNKVPDMVAARPQQFHRGRPDQCPAFHPRRDGGGHLLCFRYAFGRHRVDLGAERCRGDFRSTARKPPTGWWSSPRARRRPGGCKSATPGTFRSAFPICRTTACSMRTRSSNTNGRRASTAISRGSSSSDVERQKQYYERLARANAGVNTDWKRMALRTGFNHIHNLMLSGGSQDFPLQRFGQAATQ